MYELIDKDVGEDWRKVEISRTVLFNNMATNIVNM